MATSVHSRRHGAYAATLWTRRYLPGECHVQAGWHEVLQFQPGPNLKRGTIIPKIGRLGVDRNQRALYIASVNLPSQPARTKNKSLTLRSRTVSGC